MKNDTKTTITIEMNNVDHATRLKNALEKMFRDSDMGGDLHLRWGDDVTWYDVEYIGHDVRKAKIKIKYAKEKDWYNTCETTPMVCRG